MISRYEWLYIKGRIAKIEDILRHYEQGQIKNPDYKEEDFANLQKMEWIPDTTYDRWRNYMALPEATREKLTKDWDEYYKKCRNNDYGKLFFSMRQAFREQNISLLKEMVAKSHTLTAPHIVKPSTIDPNELIEKMEPYFMMKGSLRKLKVTYDEYEKVYQPKGERDGL